MELWIQVAQTLIGAWPITLLLVAGLVGVLLAGTDYKLLRQRRAWVTLMGLFLIPVILGPAVAGLSPTIHRVKAEVPAGTVGNKQEDFNFSVNDYETIILNPYGGRPGITASGLCGCCGSAAARPKASRPVYWAVYALGNSDQLLYRDDVRE